MLTLQEIFNKSTSMLLAQGQPSVPLDSKIKQGPNCLYRSVNSEGKPLGCAVGVLIADEDYRPEFDKTFSGTVASLIRQNEQFAQAMTNAGIDISDRDVGLLLADLQTCHDSTATGFESADEFSSFNDRLHKALSSVLPKYYAKFQSLNRV